MREVQLPSGAVLKISIAEFAVSKALYQAVLRGARHVQGDKPEDLIKEVFCIGFSSPEIEACLWECFKRCLYNTGSGDFKITPDSFEPVERRADYMKVCIEVAKDNISPFVSSLYAAFQDFRSMYASSQA